LYRKAPPAQVAVLAAASELAFAGLMLSTEDGPGGSGIYA
jgi:hypothetical protein